MEPTVVIILNKHANIVHAVDDVFCNFFVVVLYYNFKAECFLVPLNGRRAPRKALIVQLNFKLRGK